MITEIILIIFVIIYYLFSCFLIATIISEDYKKENSIVLLGKVFLSILIAPIASPIILGIAIGQCIRNN